MKRVFIVPEGSPYRHHRGESGQVIDIVLQKRRSGGSLTTRSDPSWTHPMTNLKRYCRRLSKTPLKSLLFRGQKRAFSGVKGGFLIEFEKLMRLTSLQRSSSATDARTTETNTNTRLNATATEKIFVDGPTRVASSPPTRAQSDRLAGVEVRDGGLDEHLVRGDIPQGATQALVGPLTPPIATCCSSGDALLTSTASTPRAGSSQRSSVPTWSSPGRRRHRYPSTRTPCCPHRRHPVRRPGRVHRRGHPPRGVEPDLDALVHHEDDHTTVMEVATPSQPSSVPPACS